MKKLIKNTTCETCCVRHCCWDTPKRAVHAQGEAVSINTKVKSEDTEITDSRNHRHAGVSGALWRLPIGTDVVPHFFFVFKCVTVYMI